MKHAKHLMPFVEDFRIAIIKSYYE